MFNYNIFLVVLFVGSVKSGCQFNIATDNAPFVVRADSSIPVTNENGTVDFEQSEFFYVKCRQGTSSFLLAEEGDLSICLEFGKFINTRTTDTVEFYRIACTPKSSITSLRKLSTKCANDFTFFEIGVPIYGQFAPVITVCFDEQKLTPFYAILTNTSASKEDASKSFTGDENVYKVNMDAIYYNSSEILSHILGTQTHLQYPGYLAISDFPDVKLKKMQDDFVNTFPIDISTLVYKKTCVHDGSLRSYVGVLDVASRKNSAGTLVELYLYGNKIPIPQWSWCFSYENNPKTDGMFSFVDIIRTDSTAADSWSKICPSTSLTHSHVSGLMEGSCSVTDIIHSQLKNFVNSIS